MCWNYSETLWGIEYAQGSWNSTQRSLNHFANGGTYRISHICVIFSAQPMCTWDLPMYFEGSCSIHPTGTGRGPKHPIALDRKEKNRFLRWLTLRAHRPLWHSQSLTEGVAVRCKGIVVSVALLWKVVCACRLVVAHDYWQMESFVPKNVDVKKQMQI